MKGVISYIDNGDTLTWVIRRKFASGTVDYDVGVKVGNVWYVTPNVFTPNRVLMCFCFVMKYK